MDVITTARQIHRIATMLLEDASAGDLDGVTADLDTLRLILRESVIEGPPKALAGRPVGDNTLRVVEAAETVLRRHPEGMAIGDLYTAVAERKGITLYDTNRLITILRRHGTNIVRLRRGVYGLKENMR